MKPQKICPACHLPKDTCEFYLDRHQKDGLNRQCKRCVKAYNKRWRERTPGYTASALQWYYSNRVRRWGYTLNRRYGITIEQYMAIAESQGYRCSVCGAERRGQCGGVKSGSWRTKLHVDHCHRTGRVRGLLCSSCNRAIGVFRDSPSALRAAAAYLESGVDLRDFADKTVLESK